MARALDTCAALKSWLGHLQANGPAVDESSVRLALVQAGVPPSGLAYCMSDFNRALCRQFLRVEDAAGALSLSPSASREQQLQAEARRLAEQEKRARLPADAHRFAGIKLAQCAQARQNTQRELYCREAVDAVAACTNFRDDWTGRREATLAEAERLGLDELGRGVHALDMPPCPQTLPQSSATPGQALAAIPAPESAAATAASSAAAAAPAAAPAQTPAQAERTRVIAAYGSDCKGALQRLEDHLDGVRRRRPQQPDALAVVQVNLYMLGEQLAVLETLCRDQREFDFHKPMQESLARSLESCRESAVDPARCVPLLAW